MGLINRLLSKLTSIFSYFSTVSVRVDDSPGWLAIQSGAGPADRPWAEMQENLTDSLEAWRKNFLIRQAVRLQTAYVIGDGIRITSELPEIDEFISELWNNPENHLNDRLAPICDELTRTGEIFPVLFTNKFDGSSIIRFVPASSISYIKTDENDYEKELQYHEQIPGQVEPKIWKSKHTAKTFPATESGRNRRPEPMMLHYTINKPIGATRGESDILPALPWASRYTEWLKERTVFNRIRNKMALIWIKLKDSTQVKAKQAQYNSQPPGDGGVLVTGPDEEIAFPDATIRAFDAEADGRALRLAFATAMNIPLHFLAEGSSATRSTASEMGDPTHRHYRMRQKNIINLLIDLVTCAWKRHEQILSLPVTADLKLRAIAPDISRADNELLATALRTVVDAFATMKANGWITDELAIRLSFKFAGEILTEQTITEILSQAQTSPHQDQAELSRDILAGLDPIQAKLLAHHLNGDNYASY